MSTFKVRWNLLLWNLLLWNLAAALPTDNPAKKKELFCVN